MSDLISRKMAVDAIHEDADWLAAQGSDWQEERMERDKSILMSLPSAEPKTPSNGSITCVKSEKMHDRTTGDLISREDACEAVKNEMESWLEGDRCDYRNVVDAIMDLPSAEPEIIRCRDCKHHDGIRCFRWNSTIITGFDDYCSNAERRGEEE